MQITQDHPDFDKTIIFLDNRVCPIAIAANEEEGWVDIMDITNMAPLDLSKEKAATLDSSEPEVWTEIPTIRKYGKVEIKKV
jgi:hypothetical protein